MFGEVRFGFSYLSAIVVAIIATVVIAVVFAVLVAEMLLALVGFVAFVSPVARVPAVRTEALDGFVITPVGIGDTAAAIIPVIGFGRWCAGEEQKTAESRSGEHSLANRRAERTKRKFHDNLPMGALLEPGIIGLPVL